MFQVNSHLVIQVNSHLYFRWEPRTSPRKQIPSTPGPPDDHTGNKLYVSVRFRTVLAFWVGKKITCHS